MNSFETENSLTGSFTLTTTLLSLSTSTGSSRARRRFMLTFASSVAVARNAGSPTGATRCIAMTEVGLVDVGAIGTSPSANGRRRRCKPVKKGLETSMKSHLLELNFMIAMVDCSLQTERAWIFSVCLILPGYKASSSLRTQMSRMK
ncbi:hypothetical protein ES703_120567 [subsurface metagenome]